VSDRVKLSNKEKDMKIIIAIIAVLSTSVLAAPYVEYSNQQRYTDLDYSGEYNHVRIGYKADNGIYLEAGRDQDGNAFETGYSFNFNKRLSINGKWEGSNTDKLRHSVETEIRYTFK
jgi:hypothetical protein|tara:strand:+ start:97 stop:447 length:351 start_codon:yes stop_codon:yes gene_type:complete